MSAQSPFSSRVRWVVLTVGTFLVCCISAHAEIPKNVILMIGDGMGFEHVEAANYYNKDIFRIASVPEPSGFVLLGVGALVLVAGTRRSRCFRHF